MEDSFPALQDPPRLTRSLWVHYSYGTEQGTLLCSHGAIRLIHHPPAKFDPPEVCLQICGAQIDSTYAVEAGSHLKAVSVILPCRYVTGIDYGPPIGISGEGRWDRIIVMPEAPAAVDRVAIDVIRAILDGVTHTSPSGLN